ncbi:MAG: hypothetical protein J7J57_05370 [Caldisericaceae bacterium]|nr:hypothetical protein [Caldisericaceae bacterium]
MDEEIREYFTTQYNRVEVPENLQQKILGERKERIYAFVIVVSSVFLFSIFSILFELSPSMDSILMTVSLP